MKAIILAAGIGSRLRPLTDNKPKTLVEVNGSPILGYVLNSLSVNNIKDITICTGFESHQIEIFCGKNFPELNINYIENKEFETTNNMYSLFLAKQYLNEDTILMNGDLIFDSEIIKNLISCKETTVPVDKNCYNEESMKIVVKNGFVSSISKKIDEEDSYGCSIDIYKITKLDLLSVVSEMEKIIIEKKDRKQWTEVMLNNLFSAGKVLAKPMDIDGKKWYEIDTKEDLETAGIIFGN